MYKIEFYANLPYEFSLGVHMYHGDDNNGNFHCTAFGFILFEVLILKYKKQ